MKENLKLKINSTNYVLNVKDQVFSGIIQKSKGFKMSLDINLIKGRVRDLEEQKDFLLNRLSMLQRTSIEYGITSRKLDAVEELLEINFSVMSKLFGTIGIPEDVQ